MSDWCCLHTAHLAPPCSTHVLHTCSNTVTSSSVLMCCGSPTTHTPRCCCLHTVNLALPCCTSTPHICGCSHPGLTTQMHCVQQTAAVLTAAASLAHMVHTHSVSTTAAHIVCACHWPSVHVPSCYKQACTAGAYITNTNNSTASLADMPACTWHTQPCMSGGMCGRTQRTAADSNSSCQCQQYQQHS